MPGKAGGGIAYKKNDKKGNNSPALNTDASFFLIHTRFIQHEIFEQIYQNIEID